MRGIAGIIVLVVCAKWWWDNHPTRTPDPDREDTTSWLAYVSLWALWLLIGAVVYYSISVLVSYKL